MKIFNLLKGKELIVLAIALVILILVATAYFLRSSNNSFNNGAKQNTVQTIPQAQKPSLDDRFLVLYGKVSDVSDGLLKVAIINDPKFTDKAFLDSQDVGVFINKSTLIKKYDVSNKKTTDLTISNIKIGDFATFYLKTTASSPLDYEAVGIKVYSEDFINK